MCLGAELHALEKAGADAVHFDVMDGHFVPLLTLGVPILEQARKITTLPLDVHIMVSNPEAVAEHYLAAGANTLTVPLESTTHPHRLLNMIRQSGCKAGLALNPGTPWQNVTALLEDLDKVVIMGVNPGYSRQTHIPATARKVASLAAFCRQENLTHVTIQVDGGVNVENIASLFNAGARDFVAGGAVFAGPPESYARAIENLRMKAKA